MAVQTWIYGKPDVQYEGCVLDTYEHNGTWDSDWYAVCWDQAKQKIVRVEYDTTRCGGGGKAEIDATEEVLREVYGHFRQTERARFDNVLNAQQAKEYEKGDDVIVVKGRKVPKGTIGNVFWKGSVFNRYSGQYEDRVGIEADGKRQFLPAEYVENVSWERRLLHGKARKQKIRALILNSIPAHFRYMFT